MISAQAGHRSTVDVLLLLLLLIVTQNTTQFRLSQTLVRCATVCWRSVLTPQTSSSQCCTPTQLIFFRLINCSLYVAQQ